MTNLISILDKYNIQVSQLYMQITQIQFSVMTNPISRINKYNIEIFPYLICAVHLETSRHFVASVFAVLCSVGIVTIATVVIYSNIIFYLNVAFIFLDQVCSVH